MMTNRIYHARVLVVGFLVSCLLISCDRDELAATQKAAQKDIQAASSENALEHAVKHLDTRYVCPMHPEIVKDEAGHICPICGMDLVSRRVDVNAGAYPVVELTSAVIQNLGVRSITAEEGKLWNFIKTVGYVKYNEDRVKTIVSKTAGWVENLSVRTRGLPVKKGQLLFELYSPEFLDIQKEFIETQKKDESGINQSYSQRKESVPSRDRLRYIGVSDSMMNQIARSGKARHRIPFYAPIQGTVIRHEVDHKSHVLPYQPIMTIADTSTVWVEANVYEHQMDWLRMGLEATLEVNALPGGSYRGEVNFIYPELDPQTRSLRVRLRVPNSDGRLKPNMFSQVRIYGGAKEDVLKLPREAIIVTGERESVVLDLGEGRFQPVDVVTGMASQGEVEILSGIKAGDRVVTSGQFLIDSEANLQASFSRMKDSE